VIPILMQNLRLQGVMVGSKEIFENMNRAIAQNKLKPVIDRVFASTRRPRHLNTSPAERILAKSAWLGSGLLLA